MKDLNTKVVRIEGKKVYVNCLVDSTYVSGGVSVKIDRDELKKKLGGLSSINDEILLLTKDNYEKISAEYQNVTENRVNRNYIVIFFKCDKSFEFFDFDGKVIGKDFLDSSDYVKNGCFIGSASGVDGDFKNLTIDRAEEVHKKEDNISAFRYGGGRIGEAF